MNSKMSMRYKNIASYNRETYQFLKFIGLLQIIEKFYQQQINQNKVVITLQEEGGISEETEEWAGFVQTMKKFVKKQLQATKDDIIQKQDERLTKIEKSLAEMKEMKEIKEMKEMIAKMAEMMQNQKN